MSARVPILRSWPAARKRAALAALLVFAAVLLPAGTAAAQDSSSEVVVRGNYWRDRNTRVLAPTASVQKTFPTGTTVQADYLLDAITSASAAAGGLTDQAFTELRNEVGASVGQRAGPATVTAQYRYSAESDYWSHTAGLNLSLDLLQKNLTLSAAYVYGHNQVGMRRGALGFIDVGTLQTHYAALGGSLVLSRWAVASLSGEVRVEDGFQANPYRQVKVSGSPAYEVDPTFRVRGTVTGEVRLTPVFHRGVVRYLTIVPRYRFYIDDWGIVAHAPELRLYLGLGPTELRVTGRYSTQSAADFYREMDGVAGYDVGVPRADCPAASGCYTGDSKLSAFDSFYLEGRFMLDLGFIEARGSPWRSWLDGVLVSASVGHYWNSGYANVQFGDAWVAGLELVLPM